MLTGVGARRSLDSRAAYSFSPARFLCRQNLEDALAKMQGFIDSAIEALTPAVTDQATVKRVKEKWVAELSCPREGPSPSNSPSGSADAHPLPPFLSRHHTA